MNNTLAKMEHSLSTLSTSMSATLSATLSTSMSATMSTSMSATLPIFEDDEGGFISREGEITPEAEFLAWWCHYNALWPKSDSLK